MVLLDALELVSNLVLYLFPLFVLPISLWYDYTAFLRFSLIFVTFHLAWGFIRLLLKEKVLDIAWIIQIPAMILFCGSLFLYLPQILADAYGGILTWSGPVLLILECIQFVRIVMHFSYRMVEKMAEDSEKENAIKAGILGVSGICFTIFGWVIYHLFTNPHLTVELSSYLSVLTCTMIGLTILVIVIESGVISDVAFIALFLAFIARMAIKESSMPHSAATGSFQYLEMVTYYNITQMPITQFLSLDFLISSILAIGTVISIPYFDLETEDTTFAQTVSEDEEALTRGWQKHIFGAALVMFYSHVILTATEKILPAGPNVRMAQSAVTILFYCYRLFKSSKSDGFKED
eukprot:TRINITY_DN5258_c0_g1_i1.p1 TRINITY_DN5258_c0_g1~~TRINITY_DN5258_c0_g1_i1.p1  ORF type:complete len:349 (-),score=97.89 TRINITY_DN5258_c0_g1_i1:111-1157(-)